MPDNYGKWEEIPEPNFPSVTPEVLQKLKDGFMRGYTNEQAAFFAGISVSTLQAYIKNNPEYSKKKDLYKQNIKILAKNVIWEDLTTEGKPNSDLGLKVLDRLEKENYSTKEVKEVTGANGDPLSILLNTIDGSTKGKDHE